MASCDSIMRALHLMGLCPRCILRSIGVVKNVDYFQENVDTFIFNHDLPSMHSLCTLCCGILQFFESGFPDSLVETLGPVVQREILSQGHKSFDYALSVAVPSFLLIRTAVVDAFIKCNYTDFSQKVKLSLKDVLKIVAVNFLKIQLDAVEVASVYFSVIYFGMQSTFHVRLAILPSLEECVLLGKVVLPRFDIRDPIPSGSLIAVTRALNTLEEHFDAQKKKNLDLIHPLLKYFFLFFAFGSSAKCNLFPLAPISIHPALTVLLERDPFYLSGFYSKYDRELSQTPFEFVAESVSDLIAKHMLQVCSASSYKFCSSGREDVDVRLLSENECGRQFSVELVNCRKPIKTIEDCLLLETRINEDEETAGRIKIFQLCIADSSVFSVLKLGEEKKRKEYRCVVWASRLLAQKDLLFPTELSIQQNTPLRVLHRRTAMIRPRTIYSFSAELLGGYNGKSHFFILDLVTQAGTYIKEFVHGDLGRTKPNLGDLLGCETDIIQLDVKGLLNVTMNDVPNEYCEQDE